MITEVKIVSPRGFCAGVARAVKAVEDTLALFGAPVYVKHEIVHNRAVVERLAKLGAVTVERVAEVPEGAVLVFSAHGSPPDHYAEARERCVTLIDATCPLVTKVHLEVQRYLKAGYSIVYIGHKGHVEGIGVMAEGRGVSIPIVETVTDVKALNFSPTEKLVFLTQTTLSVDDTHEIVSALRKKFPQIEAPPIEDICYATTNRQAAVKALAQVVELVLVVGSQNSSNSRRLMETAKAGGVPAYLVDGLDDMHEKWFEGKTIVGVTAGASAPEESVQEILNFFRNMGASIEEFIVQSETMRFSEPVELMRLRRELSV